jgi:hypothetical protein
VEHDGSGGGPGPRTSILHVFVSIQCITSYFGCHVKKSMAPMTLEHPVSLSVCLSGLEQAMNHSNDLIQVCISCPQAAWSVVSHTLTSLPARYETLWRFFEMVCFPIGARRAWSRKGSMADINPDHLLVRKGMSDRLSVRMTSPSAWRRMCTIPALNVVPLATDSPSKNSEVCWKRTVGDMASKASAS